jgi:hypothetical protein
MDAHNRDRGGAQHEMGDVEINGDYFGCKRRKKIAQWLYPEKKEKGVFIREDRGELLVVVPVDFFMALLSSSK